MAWLLLLVAAGAAYAAWTGLGSVGVVALIVAGVIGLRLAGSG